MTSPSILGKQIRSLGRVTASVVPSFLQKLSPATMENARKRNLTVKTFFLGLTTLGLYGCAQLAVDWDNITRDDAQEVMLDIPTPDLSAELHRVEQNGTTVTRTLFVRRNETLLSLFARLGVRDPDAERFIIANPSAVSLLFPYYGQFVKADVLPDGRISRLRLFHLDDGKDNVVEILRDGSRLSISEKPQPFSLVRKVVGGRIQRSARSDMRRMGVPGTVQEALGDAFDTDRNPLDSLRPGDSFRLIYEEKHADGHFVRNGRLLAMQFRHAGKVTEYFLNPKDGFFYNSRGVVCRRVFTRVPLDVKNVTSEFSPLRRHPITGQLRPHRGTDISAPMGSIVRAAADGTVVFAGVSRSYGKYIRIEHGPDIETLYAHLSQISPAIVQGKRVSRADPIGRVGKTGLATGPHLHYELKIDDVQNNPMTVHLPDRSRLSPYEFAKFESLIAPLKSSLAGRKY